MATMTFTTRRAAAAAYRTILARCAVLTDVLASLAGKAAKAPNEEQSEPGYEHGAAVTAAYAAKGQPVKGEDKATATVRAALLTEATAAESTRLAWLALPAEVRKGKEADKGFSLDF